MSIAASSRRTFAAVTRLRRSACLLVILLLPWGGFAYWMGQDAMGGPPVWVDPYSGQIITLAQLDALAADADADGLDNAEESRLGTDPLDPDSDMDGLPDGLDPAPLDWANPSPFNGVTWYADAGRDADADGVINYYDPYPYDMYDGRGSFVVDSDRDGIADAADPAPDDPLNYSFGNGISWGDDALGDADHDGTPNFWDTEPFGGADADSDGFPNETDPAPFDPENYSPVNFLRWFWDALGDANGNGVANFFDPDPHSRPPSEVMVSSPSAGISHLFVRRNGDFDEGKRNAGAADGFAPDCADDSLRAQTEGGGLVGRVIVKDLVPVRIAFPSVYRDAGGCVRIASIGGEGLLRIHAVRDRGEASEQSWVVPFDSAITEPSEGQDGSGRALEYWAEGVRAGVVELEFRFPFRALPAGSRWADFEGPDDLVFRQTIRVYEAVLAVDGNRDGLVDAEASVDGTSLLRPFRFWINEDSDSQTGRTPLGRARGGDASEEIIDASVRDYDFPGDGVRAIACRRDLEDFTLLRLRVAGLSDLLRSGRLRIGFRWSDAQEGPSPAVNIFRCPAGIRQAKDYLADDSKAALLIGARPVARVHAMVGDEVRWLSSECIGDEAATGDSILSFVFEGAGAGCARLSLVLEISGEEGGADSAPVRLEGRGVWLRLMHAGRMIDRAYAELNGLRDAEAIPDPWTAPVAAVSFVRAEGPQAFERDPDETDECVIYVHGWRMDEAESLNWAEMSFKRLWHLGYRGRVAAFRWPTPHALYAPGTAVAWRNLFTSTNMEGMLTYNRGEYRAWHSGAALAMFVAALQSESRGTQVGFAPAKTKIFAHSMGNVVVGAGLRQGMRLGDYVMQHAAMAAMAYDDNPVLQSAYLRRATPDTETDASDPEFANRVLGLSGVFRTRYFDDVRITNFFLRKDSALWWWRMNQALRKPERSFRVRYEYRRERIPHGSHHLYLRPGPGVTAHDVLDLPEAMAFVTQARSDAAGAEPLTHGSVTASLDLNGPSLVFGDDHSAEWNRRIQGAYPYWERLSFSLGLTMNSPRSVDAD